MGMGTRMKERKKRRISAFKLGLEHYVQNIPRYNLTTIPSEFMIVHVVPTIKLQLSALSLCLCDLV